MFPLQNLAHKAASESIYLGIFTKPSSSFVIWCVGRYILPKWRPYVTGWKPENVTHTTLLWRHAVEYLLWRHTMHGWVMNIYYHDWIAQGRFTNIICTSLKQWGGCDKVNENNYGITSTVELFPWSTTTILNHHMCTVIYVDVDFKTNNISQSEQLSIPKMSLSKDNSIVISCSVYIRRYFLRTKWWNLISIK